MILQESWVLVRACLKLCVSGCDKGWGKRFFERFGDTGRGSDRLCNRKDPNNLNALVISLEIE